MAVGITFLILFWNMASAGVVHACQWGEPDHSVAFRTTAADVVFEGKVLNRSLFDYFNGENGVTAQIIVHQYIKGDGPAFVKMAGFGLGGDCKSSVEPGDHLLFFASLDTEGKFMARHFSAYDAVETAEADVIAEAIEVGKQTQDPIIKKLTIIERLTIGWQKTRWWISGIVLVFVAINIWQRLTKKDNLSMDEQNLSTR